MFRQIGVIHTPYREKAPFQPVDSDSGDFSVEIYPEYQEGLFRLDRFRYVILLYYLHRLDHKSGMRVHPPWAAGHEVGVFASRAPARPLSHR